MKERVLPAIGRALTPFRLRLRLDHALKGMCWGIMAAAAACSLLVALSFLLPLAGLWQYMIIAAAVAFAAGVFIGFFLPVTYRQAACIADKAGLAERAITALGLNEYTPMALLQREDAIKWLSSLPPKKALPLRVEKRPLFATGAIALVTLAALLFIPNPQNQVLARRDAFQAAMANQAKHVEKTAEKLGDGAYAKEQRDALRKVLGDLARDLRGAREPQQAYLAMDKAQKRMESMLRQASEVSRQSAAQAFDSNGLKDLAQALKNGDGEAVKEAAAKLAGDGNADENAKALDLAAKAMEDGDWKDAVQAAAQALASGNAQNINAALESLGEMAQSMDAGELTGDLNALMSQLRSGALTAAQSGTVSTGSGSGPGAAQGQGQGQGLGQGQSAGQGAGTGSTNQDQGVSQGQPSGQGQGAKPAAYKLGQYETIYDPTRLDGAETAHQATGQVGEGDSQKVQLGPGLGNTSGQVPYQQVIFTYQEAASKAAQQAALPETLLKWVDGYFQSLID